MQVNEIKTSPVKDHGHIGYCPHCHVLINQKSSMFKCYHCKQPIEWTKIQELAEEIRKEVSQLRWDRDKVNELLDNIILETKKYNIITKGT